MNFWRMGSYLPHSCYSLLLLSPHMFRSLYCFSIFAIKSYCKQWLKSHRNLLSYSTGSYKREMSLTRLKSRHKQDHVPSGSLKKEFIACIFPASWSPLEFLAHAPLPHLPATSSWVLFMQPCLQQHENAASLFHIYWIYLDNPWYSPHLKVNCLAILISSVTFNPFVCHRRRRRRKGRQMASLTQCTWVWTSDGPVSLACCSPWSHKESDMTNPLNWTYSQVQRLGRRYLWGVQW